MSKKNLFAHLHAFDVIVDADGFPDTPEWNAYRGELSEYFEAVRNRIHVEMQLAIDEIPSPPPINGTSSSSLTNFAGWVTEQVLNSIAEIDEYEDDADSYDIGYQHGMAEALLNAMKDKKNNADSDKNDSDDEEEDDEVEVDDDDEEEEENDAEDTFAAWVRQQEAAMENTGDIGNDLDPLLNSEHKEDDDEAKPAKISKMEGGDAPK